MPPSDMQEEGKASPSGRASAPSWLDSAFLQNALRQGGEADAIVDAVEIRHANAVGENYLSTMFRAVVHIRGRASPVQLLVKCLPEGEAFRQRIAESEIFEKEARIFKTIIPEMEKRLDAIAPGRFSPFTARCLHHGVDPSHFIVLQDLAPLGFRMGDRHAGLDMEHAFLAVRALARFHAISHVLWKEDASLFCSMDSILEGKNGEEMKVFTEQAMENFSAVLKSWTDFSGHFDEKLLSIKNAFYSKIQESNRFRPENFNVLIHGDFWVNNLLFRYELDEVCDIRIVDLQMCRIATPAVDLLLLKYTSLPENIFFDKWDTLLEEYHKCLSEILVFFGKAAPTLKDLQYDLEQNAVHGMMVSFTLLPIIKLDPGQKMDMETSKVDGQENAHAIFKSTSYKRWIKKLLPIFEEQGLFNPSTYTIP